MNLKGKKTLVLGASGSLGKAVALALASEGAGLCLQYNHNAEPCSEVLQKFDAQTARSFSLQADLSQEEAFPRLFQEHHSRVGSLDILVNCVGDFLQKPLDELKPAEFAQIINSNLQIAYNAAHYALPYIRQSVEGRILFFGYATSTQLEAKPSILPYHIAKLGLVLLTKTLAKTEAPHKILVNCLSPAIVESSKFWPKNELPLGRPAKLSEVVEAALFLLKSDYITGQNLEIDGAWRGSAA